MRVSLLPGLIAGLCLSLNAAASDGRVIKVLPYLLDARGRTSESPSLFERDAYQAYLRRNPRACSGLRFDVQWKADASHDLTLRVELRGVAEDKQPRQLNLEKSVSPPKFFSRWSNLALTGDAYKNFGEVTAWRVTLWDGENLLGEQQSFLWEPAASD